MRFYAIRRFDKNGRPLYWMFRNSYQFDSSWTNIFNKDCIASSAFQVETVFDTYFDDDEFQNAHRVTYELTEINPEKPVA